MDQTLEPEFKERIDKNVKFDSYKSEPFYKTTVII